MSILPVYTAIVFGLCLSLITRAARSEAITRSEAHASYALFVGFALWVGIVTVLGLRGLHVRWMQDIPLLWQALVPMVIWQTAFLIWPRLQQGILKSGAATPAWMLTLIQSLRIGALGGIAKGLSGDIQSSYVFWIGIPDFLFGLSTPFMAWLLWRGQVSAWVLILWNLIGFGLIVLPTFAVMLYWMREPGFAFIFEFPMVLAPSIVVSLFVSLNLLQAWLAFQSLPKGGRADPVTEK